MKKVLSFILAMLVLTSLTVMPAFADSVELETPVFSEDFEDYDVTSDRFVDTDKPDDFKFTVGENNGMIGASIADNGVGGSKSLTLWRSADEGSNTPGNIKVTGLDSDYGSAKQVAVEFAFNIKDIGAYGFTGIISEADVGAWQAGMPYVSVKRANPTNFENGSEYDGKIVVSGFVKGNEVISATLETGKDYTLTAVFTLGTVMYDLYLNGTKIGTFENGINASVGSSGTPVTKIDTFRLDQHGKDSAKDDNGYDINDNVYYDNIKIAAVKAISTGGSTGGSTGNTPNTDTGDASFAVIVFAAVIAAAVVMKKRAYR